MTALRAVALVGFALLFAFVPAAAAQLPVVGGEPPAEEPAPPPPSEPVACDPDLEDCGEPCSPDVDDACAPECDSAGCATTDGGGGGGDGSDGDDGAEGDDGAGRPQPVADRGGAGGGVGGLAQGGDVQGVAGVTRVEGAAVQRELPATGGEALVLALAGLALLAGGLALRLRFAAAPR